MNVFQVVLRFLTGFTPNENINHSITGCEELLSKAKHTIHIVAGDLDSQLFENPTILDILQTITTREKNPVNVKILFGPKTDSKTQKLFEMAQGNANIELIKLRERPTGHFIVVDGKHTRVEEFHEQSAPERKAYMAYDTIFLGDKLEAEFDNLMSQVVNVS